jgi:hypothetical protein
VERLRNGIVQLTSQSLSFLHHGRLLGLLVKLGIFHSYADLIADGAKQLNILLGELPVTPRYHCEGTQDFCPRNQGDDSE